MQEAVEPSEVEGSGDAAKVRPTEDSGEDSVEDQGEMAGKSHPHPRPAEDNPAPEVEPLESHDTDAVAHGQDSLEAEVFDEKDERAQAAGDHVSGEQEPVPHLKAEAALKSLATASNPFTPKEATDSHEEGARAVAPPSEVTPLRKTGRPALDMFDEGRDIATLDHEGWDAFVDRLESQSITWAASLEHAELQRVEKGKVIIAFEPGSANSTRVEKYGRELLRFLKRDFTHVTGLGIDQTESVENCPYRRRVGRVKHELDRRRGAIGEHPVVTQLVEQFDAKVARLRVYGEEEYGEY